MKTEKNENQRNFWDCRIRCREWVSLKEKIYEKMDQKSLRYGDMVNWKNHGFVHEGKGKLCYAEFEPRNASLFLTEPTPWA